MNRLDPLAERDMRDTLTETLGFGVTSPLQNIPLAERSISAPHDSPAKIVLRYSQKSTRYRLTEGDCASGSGASVPGTGKALVLPTENVTEDKTYTICAWKPSGTHVPLHQRVRVHVGLDTSIAAWIVPDAATGVRALTESQDTLEKDAPRLAPFGVSAQVMIDGAQEGVDYQLEAEPATDEAPGEVISQATVRGLGAGQVTALQTKELRSEDLVVRVRATSRFGGGESRLLETRLPLMLMADPGLAVGLAGGAVIDYDTENRVTLEGSQKSARYRVFGRPLHDGDYRPVGQPPDRVFTVTQQGEPRVTVGVPERFLEWRAPADFAPLSELVAGTGAALEIPVPEMRDDHILLVQAQKAHEGAGEPVSSVRLVTPAVVLVRPDPEPELALHVDMADTSTTLHGGQAGVFYHLRTREQPGGEFRLPGYIHRRDALDPQLNRGVGSLEIGIDFAVAREADPVLGERSGAPASDPPPPPRVATRTIAAGTDLYLRAVKSQTDVAVQLNQHATIPAVPTVEPTAPEVARGEPAQIAVRASDAADRHGLWHEGAPVGDPQDGTGEDLLFETPPVQSESIYVMRIERRDAEGLTLVREVRIRIGVRSGS